MTAEHATALPDAAPRPSLSDAQRRQAYLFGGALLLLVHFSGPSNGMIDIPVTFFLKNRMHLGSNELAVFKLWAGAPLFVSFVFGFLRDRWSPFGRGDRAHLVLFGAATALIYAAVAMATPSYAVFMVGLFVATMAFQMAGSAAYGITNTIAQRNAVSGRMGSVLVIAASLPSLIAFFFGGLLSQQLEGHGAVVAARILFFVAAALVLGIAAFGAFGPAWIFAASRHEESSSGLLADLARLAKHRPIYPVIVMQLLWQFSPATGTVLQYHIVDTLKATDAEWGLWNAVFNGAFLPVYLVYGLLCRKVPLRALLWLGFGIAVFQMVPLLFVHSASGAILAAVPIGSLGALAQAAIVDLTIRSAPPGMHGTTMMMFWAMFHVSVRFGDLLGTHIYDHHGGFIPAVAATILATSLTLPVILFVSKRLTSTTDGVPSAA